jgi:hypothetical protein
MHVIAAKAVAFKEAMTHEFRAYQAQVLDNAVVMAKVLTERGLRVVSGRTESHVFLLDLRAKRITGKDAEAVLGRAHITVNKNAIPNDPEKPFVTSGIRIGSPAMTTRGFAEARGGAARAPHRRRAGRPAGRCRDRPRRDRRAGALRAVPGVSAALIPGTSRPRDARIMKCPFCGHADTQVIDSRVSEDGDSVRRRRRCLSCDKRFTTYETVELRMPQIVKTSGHRSEFDESKLRTSFTRALHKRPVPPSSSTRRSSASRSGCWRSESARWRRARSGRW